MGQPEPGDDGGTAAAVDLGAVVSGLLASPEWQTQERSSASIVHTRALRVVVTALHRGATLHNDDPDESVTIHGLRGETVVSINGDGVAVDEGTLLGVPAGTPWRLTAATESVVLLTVART
jgi:quercetin dioxygenase-like cupin family protein